MFGAPSNVHEVAPEDMLIPPHFATICEGLLQAKCQRQPERQAQLIKAFVREELV